MPREVSTDLSHLDALVIGAGFAGLYAIYKLRELGVNVRGVEAGDGVGGTWYWNRYPGARVDVQGIEYAFSFSKELQQEWDWTNLMPEQPEVEAYLNFVADRMDLRRSIEFSTRITRLHFDERTNRWTASSDTGRTYEADYVIAATGCLSAPLEPAIEGMATFAGDSLFTNRFPKEGYDFTGKRVGLVGTGSSGVQAIPVIAAQAGHLTVFQRSAAYTRPANARPLRPGELDGWKAEYDDIREREMRTFAGLIHFGAVSVEKFDVSDRILETPKHKRLQKLDERGWDALMAWADVMTDLEANAAATELYAEMISRTVRDAETVRKLTPSYPMGCKRQILDTNYFETFNRPNVTLVDLRDGRIRRVTPEGIDTEQGMFDLDVIVWATGFDAMTGALSRIDVRGRSGQSLGEFWDANGPLCYLGLQVAGFPNLFTVTGPGSPSVLANMVLGIEHHIDLIADSIQHVERSGFRTIEPTPEAQEQWAEHVASMVEGSVRTAPSCNSWYVGANVPGKKRVHMAYTGGFPKYRQECAEIVDAGYRGFRFD